MDRKKFTDQDRILSEIISKLKDYSVEEVALICKKHKEKMRMAEVMQQIAREERKHKESLARRRSRDALNRARKKGEDRSENV
jgi:hypothetical protein